MSVVDYELTDRITRDEGRVFLTGVQALARLPFEQLRVDRANGLRTAAFVSGYPGSPLAGLDLELARAARLAPDLPVVLQPALNEELGVSAVMGSQLATERPDARYDGVVGIWYGKAPGLDRASDALRHAVYAGTAPAGGAVAIVGDDPAAKSSTLPSSSDATMVDLHLPILYPADVSEALELGRHAIALSRASGLWVGLKIVTAVADGSSTIDLDPGRVQPVMPTIDGHPYRCRPDGLLLGAHANQIDEELRGIRSDLAVEYGARNELNRVTVASRDAWLGVIASGVTYRELSEAFRRLGLDDAQLSDAGIRVLEMKMPVPFDPLGVRRFAHGLEQIMVVEEMNPTLERLVRDCLYDAADRPVITGKVDTLGNPQFPSHGLLDADRMVEPLRRALADRLGERLRPVDQPRERIRIPITESRTPFFCPGCPHNLSTRTPPDTLVGAGIGCHTMAMLSDDERLGEIVCISAMGSEGAPWIGMSPFVETTHFTQNLGDGTYFHSGQLAVQAAVDAGVDMTYKILLNGHVAMTGGQRPPGLLDAPRLAEILLLQGVSRVIITTDDEERVSQHDMPEGVEVWDRRRIEEAQVALAAIPGVTVMIHDQACTAQLRRERRTGDAPTPDRRIMINERVCEGCGDCAERSSCLAVQPVDTPYGPKTRIDQAGCNLDHACLDGDCPSFLTVRRARRPKWWPAHPRPTATDQQASAPAAPDPGPLPDPPAVGLPFRVRLAGIGGTGVVTAAQVIATAAMLDGHEVRGLDQTGLSQKAGPVVSDLVLVEPGSVDNSNRLGDGQADALIAFDTVAAAADGSLDAADRRRTRLVGSTSTTPTASTVTHPGRDHDDPALVVERIESVCLSGAQWIDAFDAVDRLVGQRAVANTFVLGMAVQSGALPVSPESFRRAVELNGIEIDANLAAFMWGRLAVSDRSRFVAAVSSTSSPEPTPTPLPAALTATLTRAESAGMGQAAADLVRRRAEELIRYQNTSLAAAYLATVERVATSERQAVPGSNALTQAVAEQLFRVLAYKDEYEVARLLLDEGVLADARGLVDGPARVAWALHPPVLRDRGLSRKIEIGIGAAPFMRLLTRGKRLRGTRLDPFGRTDVRRAERQLIATYQDSIDELIAGLSIERHSLAIEIAELPARVRGYEHRKLDRIAEYESTLDLLLDQYRALP